MHGRVGPEQVEEIVRHRLADDTRVNGAYLPLIGSPYLRYVE